jgi:hypothetical protein
MIVVKDGLCDIKAETHGEIVVDTIALFNGLTDVFKKCPEITKVIADLGGDVELEFIKELEKGTK